MSFPVEGGNIYTVRRQIYNRYYSNTSLYSQAKRLSEFPLGKPCFLRNKLRLLLSAELMFIKMEAKKSNKYIQFVHS